MIGYLEGKLLKVGEDRILLLVNQVGYEVLLPTYLVDRIRRSKTGDPLSLHIFYQQTERQPKPVLIGFNTEEEKEFFQHFISVEDIGPLKAVKAMTMAVGDIARAIESKDLNTLKKLKGIGSRTAQKIVASLSGKVERFAFPPASDAHAPEVNEDIVNAVIGVLVSQLGHKMADAKRLVAEALDRNRMITTPEELFDEVYRGESRPQR